MSDRGWRPSRNIRPVPCPQTDRRPWIRQVIPPAGGLTLYLAIHNHVQGYSTHWIDGRTRPCLGSSAWCEGCQRLQAPRWEGYLGVLSMPLRAVRILKLTRGAFANCEPLQKFQGRLRGFELQCKRRGQTNNSPLQVQLANPKTPIELPAMWPLHESLARLWGYDVIGDIERAEVVDLAEIDAAVRRSEGGAL